MKKTIYYYPFFGPATDSGKEYTQNPFSEKDIDFPLEPQFDLHEKLNYTKCPAWQQIATTSYAVRSPIPLWVEYDKKQGALSSDLYPEQFDELIVGTDRRDGIWKGENEIVFQFQFGYLFWTDHKNIWVEQAQYPTTLVKNNFEIVEGRFPISVWNRGIPLAVRMRDLDKVLRIERGDILYFIRFFSDFDRFKLVKKVPSPDVVNKSYRHQKIKHWLRNESWQLIKNRLTP